MAEAYLLPEDVSSTHAAQVLAFLNAATTVEEIAAAVEISGELDVGLRVAARILARRNELDGFTSLGQVYAVPYVGPERFTELVTSLSEARPPSIADDRLDRRLLAEIAERLSSLEAQVRPTPTIKLSALNPAVWVGQENVLLAEAKDARGKPLVDAPVTFMTTWGRLRGRAGAQELAGNSVTVRTDHLGLCTLHLGALLGERLTDVQRASLGAALAMLGDGSVGPTRNAAALAELARRYRAEGNEPLRRAIDAYFRRYQGGESGLAPLDAVGWPSFSVTVLAFLAADAAAFAAQPPTALLSVQQRNWFDAWTAAYRAVLDIDSTLGASLGDVAAGERASSGILTDLLGRVRTFMRHQDGLVGQVVGQEFAQARLNDFVQTSLAKVSAPGRSAVLSGVSSGTAALAGGSKLFAAFDGSRVDLGTRLETGLASVDSSAAVGSLTGRIAQLETDAVRHTELAGIQQNVVAAATASTAQQLAQLRTEIDATFATKVDIARLDVLTRDVAQLQVQTRNFGNNLATVTTRLNGVDSSIANLSTRVRDPQ